MLNTPRQSALILTKGGTLDNEWPAVKDDFDPAGSTRIDFYDSTGNVIATATGTVEAKRLVYQESPDVVDEVPNGAQYELFYITAADEPYKVEYGHVIRREAAFYTPQPASVEADLRLFTDLLSRDAVGRRWVATQGRVSMHNLTGGLYGMGPDTGLFYAKAGVRYVKPFSGDSFRVGIKVYSDNSFAGAGGVGKMRFMGGCDISMNVGMSFEMDTTGTEELHTGLITSPTSITYTGSAVEYETVTNDVFTITYSDLTKIMSIELNGSEVMTWEDDQNLPKGPGFRYWGFSWDSSLAATGPVLLQVEAQDYVV